MNTLAFWDLRSQIYGGIVHRSIKKGTNGMSKLEVSLSQELHAELKTYAEGRGIKASEAIPDLVATGLSRKRALSKYAKATAKEKKATKPAKAAAAAKAPKGAKKAVAAKPVKAAAKPAKVAAKPATKPAAKEEKPASSVDRIKALKASAAKIEKPQLKPAAPSAADAVN